MVHLVKKLDIFPEMFANCIQQLPGDMMRSSGLERKSKEVSQNDSQTLYTAHQSVACRMDHRHRHTDGEVAEAVRRRDCSWPSQESRSRDAHLRVLERFQDQPVKAPLQY